MDLTELAKDIIKNNQYLTLATTDGKQVWAAALYYCFDASYNFYFSPQKDTVHADHIAKNPQVAVTIFDSHQPKGSGTGIQMSATCREIGLAELPASLAVYHTSVMPLNHERLSGSSPDRLYKLAPEHVYVLIPDPKIDRRIEINI